MNHYMGVPRLSFLSGKMIRVHIFETSTGQVPSEHTCILVKQIVLY